MSLWTHQEGFPLLTMMRNGRTITISQKHFQPAEFEAIHDETYHGNSYQKIEDSNDLLTKGANLGVISASTIGPNTSASTNVVPIKQLPPKKWIFPITYITDLNNNSEIVWMQNINGKKYHHFY